MTIKKKRKERKGKKEKVKSYKCGALFAFPFGRFFLTKNKITINNYFQNNDKEKKEGKKRKKGKSKIL